MTYGSRLYAWQLVREKLRSRIMTTPTSDTGVEDSEESWRSGYESITPVDLLATPPTYVVRETSDGRLVNDSFGVEWPERPSYGRYSLDAYEASKRGGKASPKQRRRHRRRKKGATSNRFTERCLINFVFY
ncbi:hypothetical protein Tcan_10613 [Toxocara canis]|uniref:Uncharacterized protein n=1 Tax=Toxocara canis TaxID=6265 RepID=A0A0B2VC08_TOXCA|nr:hypothetical protein Tcan_10613 [Toxocara canis]